MEAVDNALDVFETSLHEAIIQSAGAPRTLIRAVMTRNLMASGYGSRPRRQGIRSHRALRPTTLGRIYSITRLLWQPGLQLRLPREVGLLLLLRLLQKPPSLILWLPASLLQRHMLPSYEYGSDGSPGIQTHAVGITVAHTGQKIPTGRFISTSTVAY